MKKDLQDIFEEKKIENEFENKDPNLHLHMKTTGGGTEATFQVLMTERQDLKKRMQSYKFQAEQLERRLYFLQKNCYDDMKIIDYDHKASGGETFTWRSDVPYTRNQYKFWVIEPNQGLKANFKTKEVSIRKAGHEKEIKVLDNICTRIMALDKMYFKAAVRSREIKQLLNTGYTPRLGS